MPIRIPRLVLAAALLGSAPLAAQTVRSVPMPEGELEAVLRGKDPADDPRACALMMVTADAASHAVRCAEDFVRRNGYTAAPAAVDSTTIAGESIERGRSLAEVRAARAGQLHWRAVGICSGGGHAWTIVFRYREGEAGRGRAVTMTGRFDGMRVEHRDFQLDAVTEGRDLCRPV